MTVQFTDYGQTRCYAWLFDTCAAALGREVRP